MQTLKSDWQWENQNLMVLLACTVYLEYIRHFNCTLGSIKHFILTIKFQFSGNNLLHSSQSEKIARGEM